MTAKRIVRVPGVCGGRPVFEGTRIWPEIPYNAFVRGYSPLHITDNYPALTEEDVHAAVRWCSRPHRRLIRWMERQRARIVNEAWHRWGHME